jgi:UDP-GlcNAc:undecaprenyl-phosphate GlcNAc-1-phosphate transferase
MLGIISLFGSARTAMIMSMFVPIIAAGVPIVDTTLAIIRRTLAHRPIDEADKGHIHHRLLQSGYTQKTTVHIMWAWTAVLAACGLLIMEFDGPIRLVAFLVAFGVTFYGIRKLHLLKPVLAHHYSHRKDGEWTELTTQEFEAARVREQLEKAAAEKAVREEREATGSDGRHAR